MGGIVLTLGDIIMKKWAGNSSRYLYILGLFVYLIGLNFLAQSFRYKNIAIASVIFVLFNVITLALVSWFYFKEKLSFFEIGGIFLGIASIVLLEFGRK